MKGRYGRCFQNDVAQRSQPRDQNIRAPRQMEEQRG